MYNKMRRQQGFLLVDILLAVFIISTALLAIASFYIQSTQATVRSNQYTVATNLAQRQLELLKKKPATDWAAYTTFPTTIPWQDTSIDPSKLSPPVIITTTVKQCSEDATNLVEVIVIVNGTNAQANYSETFTAFFPKSTL